MKNNNAVAPPKKSRRPIVRILLIGLGVVGGIIAVYLAFVIFNLATGRARLNYTNCTKSGEVASDAARSLTNDFEIKEFSFRCADWYAFKLNEDDDFRPMFDIHAAGKQSFESLDKVGESVVTSLANIGWQKTDKLNTLNLKKDKVEYSLEVIPYSYQPAFVFISIKQISERHNDISFINNIYPYISQSPKDKINYSRYQIYTSSFIPNGYSSWQEGVVYLEYKWFSKSIAEGADYRLKTDSEEGLVWLGSKPLPKNYDPAKNCYKMDDKEIPCMLLAKTSDGTPIFVRREKYGGDYLYMVKGGTLLVVSAINHPNDTIKVSDQDGIKILDNIKPVNAPSKY